MLWEALDKSLIILQREEEFLPARYREQDPLYSSLSGAERMSKLKDVRELMKAW